MSTARSVLPFPSLHPPSLSQAGFAEQSTRVNRADSLPMTTLRRATRGTLRATRRRLPLDAKPTLPWPWRSQWTSPAAPPSSTFSCATKFWSAGQCCACSRMRQPTPSPLPACQPQRQVGRRGGAGLQPLRSACHKRPLHQRERRARYWPVGPGGHTEVAAPPFLPCLTP
jgi:hypothetical protein